MGPTGASLRAEVQLAGVSAGQALTPTIDSTNDGTSQTAASGVRAKPTDDEILGISPGPVSLDVEAKGKRRNSEADAVSGDERVSETHPQGRLSEPPQHLRSALDANPELRSAWEQASEYKQAFETPEKAREATALLADLNRMDSLFFSSRPEDHAELARAVAELDPVAFHSFAKAITGQLNQRRSSDGAKNQPTSISSSQGRQPQQPGRTGEEAQPSTEIQGTDNGSAHLANEQSAFLQAANASAVEGVLMAIESQVERLLPEGISKSARNRVVGEIYRELDASLQSNKELARQTREILRSGGLDVEHQRAVVSLITNRARQALPGVAKRVLGEWTTTLVAGSQERRTRQRAAEGRVDIAGTGGAANDGRRPMTPREIDYGRMSDADILNLF
jgi:hypothetical protein